MPGDPAREREPGQFSVDLVVLVDDEVTVRNRENPLDSLGRQHTEPGQPLGGLPQFRHQRVTGLLWKGVGEVSLLARGGADICVVQGNHPRVGWPPVFGVCLSWCCRAAGFGTSRVRFPCDGPELGYDPPYAKERRCR
jgi:hypothetical protein